MTSPHLPTHPHEPLPSLLLFPCQEFHSLRQRIRGGVGRSVECVCLAAVLADFEVSGSFPPGREGESGRFGRGEEGRGRDQRRGRKGA